MPRRRLGKVEGDDPQRPDGSSVPAAAPGRVPRGLEKAGNRALSALLGQPSSGRAAVQRSPLDDLFAPAGSDPAPVDAVGQETATATTGTANAGGSASPGAIVIESTDAAGRPTTTEVHGQVTIEPPLDRPAVVVRPDGTKTVLLPDPSGGIIVIRPDGTRVTVKGQIVVTPEGDTAGGGGRPAETRAEAGWLDQPALSFASRGAKVQELQELLNLSGAQPPLAADGDFGPGTLAAVKRFQAGAGLQPDGVVGPRTWEALGGTGDLPSIRSQQLHPVPGTGGV